MHGRSGANIDVNFLKGGSSASEDSLQQNASTQSPCGGQKPIHQAVRHYAAVSSCDILDKGRRIGQAFDGGSFLTRERSTVTFHLSIANKTPSQFSRDSLVMNSLL